MPKRDLHMPKRDLHMPKRDLHMPKRDLHMPKIRRIYAHKSRKCLHPEFYTRKIWEGACIPKRDLYIPKWDLYISIPLNRTPFLGYSYEKWDGASLLAYEREREGERWREMEGDGASLHHFISSHSTGSAASISNYQMLWDGIISGSFAKEPYN